MDLCGYLWIFVDICGYSIQSYLHAGRPDLVLAGCAPAFSTRRPARRAAGQQPAAGDNFEEKTATFSISLYKH